MTCYTFACESGLTSFQSAALGIIQAALGFALACTIVDMLAVNRFLNVDVESFGKDASAISTHRQNRAFTLVDATSPFIEKTQTIKVMRLLIGIASDKASVESVMNNFADFANRK